MRHFSQSEIKSWRRCQKSYDYKLNQNLVRKTTPVALLRGTTLHAMLEAHIKGEDWKVALEAYREQYSGLWGEEAENYPSPEELESIYLRYQQHYAEDGLNYGGRAEVIVTAEHEGIGFKGIIDALPDDKEGRRWLTDHKCLDSNHLVHTPRGMVRMGDLTTDDKVVGSDGSLIRILEICHQVLPGYEIKLPGNRSLRATAEHRWPTQCHGIVNTQSLMGTPGVKLLPAPRAFDWPNKSLPLDPYLVGCLIGDGSIAQGVRLCTQDDFIFREISKRAPKGSKVNLVSKPPRCPSYTISGIRGTLKLMGLHGLRSFEKHIPSGYLQGDYNQRMELLQGLMDTDGSVYKGSSYLFTTTSERLSRDIQNLVWSLGGITLIRSPKKNGYQGGKIGRRAYLVKFTLPENSFRAFKLPSKLAQLGQTEPRPFGYNLKVLDVVPVGDIMVTDITVDSEDHLFSVEGVLTHNTHKVLPDEHTRFSDIQTVLYYWACQESGVKVDGILWDYLRTKPPTVPEVLKSGGLSKRANIDTDRETYLKAIQDNGLNPMDYEDILSKVEKNTFFKRVYLPRPSKDLIHSVVTDFFGTAQEILDHGDKPFVRNMTRDCKSCSYYQLCSAEVRGMDGEFIKKQMYTVRVDDRYNDLSTKSPIK